MEPAIGAVIAGRYRVLKELGRGGMGAVYLVEHVNTGEHFALKALLSHVGANADLVERFRREARTPSRIRSEHIVKVTDADAAPELGGAPFMVMELLEGQDLEQRLAEGGPLTFAELLAVLAPVAEVLDQAHALGIVHRDLKPENLFLHHRTDGVMVVKVVDFGIAKLLDAPESNDAGLTSAGMIMGTPLFMSPEQARGDIASIGPATDIWAMGQLAYYVLSGQQYWEGPSVGEFVAQILTSPLVPPSSRVSALPPAFDAWFARSCARDPHQRWSSAGQQLQALRQALSDVSGAPTVSAAPLMTAGPLPPPATFGPMGTTAQSPMAAPPLPANNTKQRGLWLALAALVVAAAVGAAMLFTGDADESPTAKPAENGRESTDAAPSATASNPAQAAGKPHVMSALNGGATGYYEPQQLLKLIGAHEVEIRSCYADELGKQPNLKGTVFLTLMLGADHRPMTASCVPQMEGGVPRALCPCLQAKVTSWTFPPPKKPLPMISVGYKFILSTK